MTVYLLALLPVSLFFVILINELVRQRKFYFLAWVIWLLVSVGFYSVAVVHVIVTGKHLFPYSGIINRVLAVTIMPAFYMLANISVGRRTSHGKTVALFIPAIVLFFVSFLPESFGPGQTIGDHLDFKPTVHFSLNGQTVGWSLVELVLIFQSMQLIVKSWSDYHHFRDEDLRTDTTNNLINFYSLLGLAGILQSGVGCNNWMHYHDYALLDSCFNSFVMSYGLYLLYQSLHERKYITGEMGDFNTYPTFATDSEGANPMPDEMQKITIPPIDFAVSPEIPREEETVAENEPTTRDLLVIGLRTLIEQKKIYLQAGIRIDDVALTLGTNRTYLAKMMKDIYGHTFSEYMNICRLRSAQNDMLNRKDASIETIALSNGFNSSNTFNKVFNQYNGCSPAVWRKKSGG